MLRTEFERVTPESVGIRSEAIWNFLDAVETDLTEMHGLVIMRHDKIAAEGWWAPYAPGIPHMCASLTKTYMGTAIAIAIPAVRAIASELDSAKAETARIRKGDE